MGNFDPANWYWAPANLSGQVYSSASNSIVSNGDSTYAAWIARGNVPTSVANVQTALAVVIDATELLSKSDTTMHRVAEGVALGDTTWTATDVVAFVNWRRALRAIIAGTDTTSTSIPIRPAYPSGT